MIYKLLIVLQVFMYFSSSVIAQQNPCGKCIYLDALKRCLFFNKQKDTVYIELDNEFYLKALVENCKGDLYFEKRKIIDSTIVLSGFYKATGRILKDQAIMPDLDGPFPGTHMKKRVYYYYKPKRTGAWNFYNRDR